MMHNLHRLLLFNVLMCLGQNALGSEIIKGKKTNKKSMLYMASVQNSSNEHICGGFLITPDFVVTAAHCDGRNPSSVVLGTHNLKKVNETMRYGIKKCKHPSYRNVVKGNDIMLLKLSREAQLSKKTITTIPTPSHEINIQDNKTCSVAGWGYTRTGGNLVDKLQVVNVPLINLEKCQKAWHGILPANVMCAGGYGTKKGFCQGDSGGPLVCEGKDRKQHMAVGIVSFNNKNKCDYPDVPNIYTDISKYLPWIKKILDKRDC
ncbi:hypothetical protein Q5P01_016198 [Channa striata]|uniref:Peptidase S1 domain-containing protein n=1 Tax=Channa striata TaxID=64152 RepID=A0AA88MEU3_CHASR|nr:hypothetical protein Q5P01_016198 [Channa striata]